jgi:hypothetical protein
MSLRGGRRRSKRKSRKGKKRCGAGLTALLNQAAVPGLLGAALLGSRKHRRRSHKRRGSRKHRGTTKGMMRRTARRAFMPQ